ncbi:hypothetical protein DH2020_014892 [Rehmannia glutinosa]|uniref:Late embryogenesis abundant protein LEA-2 subgroup domain-containing protein n=1 Tax=Rehmannia glutinosa TaxID=99300 RepID=A0ABR0WXT7_REHGL
MNKNQKDSSKRKMSLAIDATIFNLNVSAPNVISTTVQVTVNSRNPNSNIGIYYDRLDVYATYRNQQITYYTVIPPVYQGHKDVNVWSPFIYGNTVPVAPYNGLALTQDQSDGAIAITVKINGRVRWKVGSFISGRYHLHVTCPAYIPLGNSKNTGIVIGNAVKYQLSQSCSVNPEAIDLARNAPKSCFTYLASFHKFKDNDYNTHAIVENEGQWGDETTRSEQLWRGTERDTKRMRTSGLRITASRLLVKADLVAGGGGYGGDWPTQD